MPPHACDGHTHDIEDDDLGLSLRPHIDFELVTCLNEEVPNTGKAVLKLHEDRLTQEPYLKSNEDDPELLLHIPFTEAVTVKTISMRTAAPNGIEGAAPRTIKLFTNRDDLDFDTARDMEPQATVELAPPDHVPEGTIDYQLRPGGRFQNISSLTIFVQDNFEFDDDISSLLTYVGVKGRGSGQKRMAVETVYETRGMKKDHKVKGEFGGQQLI